MRPPCGGAANGTIPDSRCRISLVQWQRRSDEACVAGGCHAQAVRGSEIMRADRLLSILLLLQVHRRLTAGVLAERLEVSERTIYRDIDALSAAGIPVHMERGSGGGCVLPDEYRTNLTGLNEAEARTLFLG